MPSRHVRFDDEGITDEVQEGRRRSADFMPIPASKRKGGSQQELTFEALREPGARLEDRDRPRRLGQLVLDRQPPFAKPSTGKIAVKVINHYGDEIVRVYELSS